MRSILKAGGLFFTAILFILTMSCGNSLTSPDPTMGTIKISIKGVTNGASNPLNKSSSLVTITSARVVIDEVELESIFDDTLDFEFEEPFVQDLMAGSSNIYEIGTFQVPFGSYKEMEIEIDDLDQEAGAVYVQNPELQDRSIYVEGFLNGDSTDTFVFTSDLNEEQEREFNPPLVIDENTTNLVLALDMAAWFMDKNNQPLDPKLESNKSIIENNIKASLEVFEDEDDDGEKDEDD